MCLINYNDLSACVRVRLFMYLRGAPLSDVVFRKLNSLSLAFYEEKTYRVDECGSSKSA